MTALARSVGTQDTVLYLDSTLDVGSLPAPFLIDGEAILVTGGDLQTQVYVARGQFGTAPAVHALGTSLTTGWGDTASIPTLTDVLNAGSNNGGNNIVTIGTTGMQNGDGSASLLLSDASALLTGNVGNVEIGTSDGHIGVLAGAGLTLHADTGDIALNSQASNSTLTLSEAGVLSDSGGNLTLDIPNFSLAINTSLLGFFGTSPDVQPVVPLTSPTVQNVINALKALGLVAQHD